MNFSNCEFCWKRLRIYTTCEEFWGTPVYSRQEVCSNPACPGDFVNNCTECMDAIGLHQEVCDLCERNQEKRDAAVA